jgi:hypothetical protein
MPKKRNTLKNNERAQAHQEKKRRLHEAEDTPQERERQPESLGETLQDPITAFREEQHPPASEAAPDQQSVTEDVGVRVSPSALSGVRMEFDNSGVIHAVLLSYKVEGTRIETTHVLDHLLINNTAPCTHCDRQLPQYCAGNSLQQQSSQSHPASSETTFNAQPTPPKWTAQQDHL